MFYKISEGQYLEIVDYANRIYESDVVGNRNHALFLSNTIEQNIEFRRARINEVYEIRKQVFDTSEKAILFKLNLLVKNNEYFARTLLIACSRFIRSDNINFIKRAFLLRTIKREKKWEKIIAIMAESFSLNEETAKFKIMEILTYSNIYYPELKCVNKESVKSLSK